MDTVKSVSFTELTKASGMDRDDLSRIDEGVELTRRRTIGIRLKVAPGNAAEWSMRALLLGVNTFTVACSIIAKSTAGNVTARTA